MATFYLIRHGENDWIARGLAGRTKGVSLNKAGMKQSEELVTKLKHVSFSHIYSSPMERTKETAAPLANATGLPIEIVEELIEIDFGEWTGKGWEELRALEGWKQFNLVRSSMRIPKGELMVEAQYRVIRLLERLSQANPKGIFAIFSHGDVIRSALTYYLGMPLDFFQRMEISPASYSVVHLQNHVPLVECVNRV